MDELHQKFLDLMQTMGPELLPLLSRQELEAAVSNPQGTKRALERAIRMLKQAPIHPNLR